MTYRKLLLAFGGLLVSGVAEDNEAVFQKEIQAVLQKSCASCHGGATPQSEFSISSYESLLRGGKHGPAIVPGSAQASLLIQYLKGEKTPQMPLGGSLPPSAIQGLAAAIGKMSPVAAGQEQKDGYVKWLLTPPASPKIPSVEGSDRVKNPIDAFVLSKLAAKQMHPAPPAARRVLIRRLYFDLIGLPPSPEEVDRFVSDSDPLAYDKLVEKLLSDARYGERWARHWLDLARYAESDGFAI